MTLLQIHSSAEAVHSVRVACRRMESAIFVCQDGLRRSDYRPFQKMCQRLRSYSSVLRDQDVLAMAKVNLTPCSKRMTAKTRRRFLKKLRLNAKKWRKRAAQGRVFCCKASSDPAKMVKGVQSRCLQLCGVFVVAWSRGNRSGKDLHRWRIATKQLRYAIEFLVACGCSIDATKSLEDLKNLQDALGRKTDAMARDNLLSIESPETNTAIPECETKRIMPSVESLIQTVFKMVDWLET
ncbi:MAG: CHAD domain-containing protein [Pirellula sp.]|jgi:CHAD domain-containing protein